MANHSRGFSSQPDWDPMRDDFDNSNYDPQYPDDSSSELVKLDHTRLYITNIPKGLNDEGLRAAFSKFGTMVEVFVSKDPNKRYGMIGYETAAEARHAMMKLNKTEPLRLNISVAHVKGTSLNQKKEKNTQNRNTSRNPRERDGSSNALKERTSSYRDRDDTVSYGSRGRSRKAETLANGDNSVMGEDNPELDEELGLDILDPDLEDELARLQLEQLKVQQAQLACKQRMLLKQAERRAMTQVAPSARCVTSDGRKIVVVRNVAEGSQDHRDGESSFAAGAGDSLTIPGLQRTASRVCVWCGRGAEAYCARCGVTPYCSARCQRRDWLKRHSAVCHNLARLAEPEDVDGEIDPIANIPVPPPLRRPRSPAGVKTDDRDEAGSDRHPVRLPPGHNLKPSARTSLSGGRTPNRIYDKPANENRTYDKSDKTENRSYDKPANGNRTYDKSDKTENRSYDKPANGNRTYDKSDKTENRSYDKPANGNRTYDKSDKTEKRTYDKQARNDKGDGRSRRDDGDDFGFKPRVRRPWQERPRTEGPMADQRREHEENWDSPRQDLAPKPAPPINEEPPKPMAAKTQTPQKPSPARAPVQATNQNGHREPAANQREAQSPATNQNAVASQKPASIADVTPTRKLVPKNYLIEVLSIGDTVVLSVDNVASECRSKTPGFICLSLHEKFASEYSSLCDEFGAACEAEAGPYTPTPGETFAYFNPEDEGWYRARCLSATEAALLDGGRIVAMSGKVARLPAPYRLQPEFCCVLQAGVKVGDSLECVLKEKKSGGFRVSVQGESGDLGEGEISRWLPEVQAAPAPAPTPAPVAQTVAPPAAKPAVAAAAPTKPPPIIPEVPRPDLTTNTTVMLVHFESPGELYVRPADLTLQREFDAAFHDVAMYGLTAIPLKEPPTMGQYVVSKFTDGHHYRALVKRTNVTKNKYLLEYVEFGNTHVNTLENLYPCPDSLCPPAAPVVTSRAALRGVTVPLTPPASAYLEVYKDDSTELVLTLPAGIKSAPSGAEVTLTVAKNKEVVNKKVEDISTPEWMHMQKRGADVVEAECVMYNSLEFVPLPAGPSSVVVLDFGSLPVGTVCGCPPSPLIQHVLTALTDQMGKYCESEIGREPYLPKAEELCIAQLPPYPQWFRAVLAEQVAGAGGAEVDVCYIDYGNLERVPTSLLRKMLPEFVRGIPALANTLQIRDFPEKPTAEQLERAVEYLNINDDGHGSLDITGWTEVAPGMYVVDAPALLKAMQ